MSKLQNDDFKTLAQLTGAGGSASQLLNDTKIYLTANGLNKQLSAAITDGSIGGGGSTNLITDGNGEAGTTNYIEGSYSAATRPSGTFTPSSGAGAFAISTTSTNPLDGTNSFLLTKSSGASRQGRAVERTVSIASKYQGRTMEAFIDYRIVSGAFVAGSNGSIPTDSSLIFYIAQSPNGSTWTFTEPQNFKLLSNSTTLSDQYVGQFQVLSDTTQVKIIAYVAETANSAWIVECEWGLRPTIYSSVQTRGPVGTIIPFGSVTPPQGFLYCDGSAVSRAQYSKLFTTIGTSYGSGDGSTTFNLPDLRGIFLRGSGSQTFGSVTYTGTLGTKQNDQFQTHGHNISDPSHSHNLKTVASGDNNNMWHRAFDNFAPSTGDGGWNTTNYGNTGSGIQGSTTGISVTTPNSGRTGSETYPANVSVAYHICYDDGNVQTSDGYDGRQIIAKVTGSQTLSNGSETLLDLTSVSFDKGGLVDISTDRLNIKSSGIHKLKIKVSVGAPAGATFNGYINCYKNGGGSPFETVDVKTFSTTGFSGVVYLNGFVDDECVAGDYFQFKAFQQNGSSASASVTTMVTIEKLQSPTTMSATEVVAASGSISSTLTTTNSLLTLSVTSDTHGSISSSLFYVPISGFYSYTAQIRGAASTAQTINIGMATNGSLNDGLMSIYSGTTNFFSVSTSGMKYFTAGQTISFRGYTDTGTYSNAGNTHFSIYRVK